jgi:hypothetical protein
MCVPVEHLDVNLLPGRDVVRPRHERLGVGHERCQPLGVERGGQCAAFASLTLRSLSTQVIKMMATATVPRMALRILVRTLT